MGVADLPRYPWDALAPFAERAAAHPDGLVDLSVGSPVDETPALVRAALSAATDAHAYPTTIGTPALREAIAASGSGPIVVVGTTNDPATPYEWSQSLAEQLENGVLVTRVGEGHTGYNKGNVCVDEAVEAYFLADTVPEGDVNCE